MWKFIMWLYGDFIKVTEFDLELSDGKTVE